MENLTFRALYLTNGNTEKDNICLESFRRHHPDAPVLIKPYSKEPYLSNLQEASRRICGVTGDYLYDDVLLIDDATFFTRPVRIKPEYDIAGTLSFCGNKELWLYDLIKTKGQKVHTGRGGTFFCGDFLAGYWPKYGIYDGGLALWTKLLKEYSDNFFPDLIVSLIAKKHRFSVGEWEECSDLNNNLGRDLYGRYVPIRSDNTRTILTGYNVI